MTVKPPETITIKLTEKEKEILDRMIEDSITWRGFAWWLVPADRKPILTRGDAIKSLINNVERERTIEIERRTAYELGAI